MQAYIVRPYFGHDCDSENGFNDGYYLPAIVVQAEDADDAVTQAMTQYVADHSIGEAEVGGWFGKSAIYAEFDHTWTGPDGTEYVNESEIPEDPDTGDPIECVGNYRYQYIDFSADVSLMTDGHAERNEV